jgi:hypothetical protein
MNKKYWIKQIMTKYSCGFISNVLKEFNLISLDQAYDNGKKNVISQILRDRWLYINGHALIGDMQYCRFN